MSLPHVLINCPSLLPVKEMYPSLPIVFSKPIPAKPAEPLLLIISGAKTSFVIVPPVNGRYFVSSLERAVAVTKVANFSAVIPD